MRARSPHRIALRSISRKLLLGVQPTCSTAIQSWTVKPATERVTKVRCSADLRHTVEQLLLERMNGQGQI